MIARFLAGAPDPARRRTAAIALAVLAGAAACRTAAETDVANGDDPIAALEAHVPSTRYERPYWHQVAQGKTAADSALWRRAVETCRSVEATQRPNCTAVQMTAFYERASQLPPKRGDDVRFKAP